MKHFSDNMNSVGGVVERQRGAALVVAMLVFAVCAALVVALLDDFYLYFRRVSNSLWAEQSHSYLLGAEDLAVLALRQDISLDRGRGRERDDFTELWAREATPYPLDEGGWLSGSVQDLQGLFNLNTLYPPANRESTEPGQASSYTPAQRQFIRLLRAFEEPAVDLYQAISITEAVGDWLDANANPTLNGAEDDYYYGMTPPYRAANRDMVSVSELQAVAHVTPEIFVALEPYITVWPAAGGRLNIHTAPAMVLRSLGADDSLEPLSEAEVESLVQLREEVGFTDLADFLSQPPFVDRQINDLGGLLGESSSYFLLTAQVQVADRLSRLYSVLHRNDQRVVPLLRSQGPL